MNAAWGPSEKRGALAFVHIPPHVVQDLRGGLDSAKEPGLNADELGAGSSQASGSDSVFGNDQPFWDALTENVPNLHAVFSGHDHGNEWCSRDNSKDVIFCFSKHTGYGGYDHGWGHGVRNIVFSSPSPTTAPETWIRMEAGDVHARITLDENYGR